MCHGLCAVSFCAMTPEPRSTCWGPNDSRVYYKGTGQLADFDDESTQRLLRDRVLDLTSRSMSMSTIATVNVNARDLAMYKQ